jgi:hypothetical protein
MIISIVKACRPDNPGDENIRHAVLLKYRLAGAEDDLKVASANLDEANGVFRKVNNGARTNSADKQQYEIQRSICANLTVEGDVISREVEELQCSEERIKGGKAVDPDV